jgi:hypothetical protein
MTAAAAGARLLPRLVKIEGRAAEDLDGAHPEPGPVRDRAEGRLCLRGVRELPERAHQGVQGEQNLEDPEGDVHGAVSIVGCF